MTNEDTRVETRYQDRLGRTICIGDVILYSTSSGTGGRLASYFVEGQTPKKLKVSSPNRYSGGKRYTHLIYPKDSFILGNDTFALEVLDKMN